MNIGNTDFLNEDKILSTAEFQFETRPSTIDVDTDQNTLDILMKISMIDRAVLEFVYQEWKRESRSKNNVNIKSTKEITFMEPLELSFSS